MPFSVQQQNCNHKSVSTTAMLHNGSSLQNLKTCSGEEVYASLCLFFPAIAPSVGKGETVRRHSFLIPQGRDNPRRSWACWEPWGKRAPLQCLEGRPHPVAAPRATRCLARPAHRWRIVCVSVLTDVILEYVRSKVCTCLNEGGGTSISCANAEATFTLEKGRNAWMKNRCVAVEFLVSS